MPPSDTLLLRHVHTARRRALLSRRNRREELLAGAIKTTISDLPIARKLRAQRVLRIPPVSKGKAGRAKIEQESIYRREIEGALSTNHQVIARLLAQPGAEEAFERYIRTSPMDLRRREPREALHLTLPAYAVRHRQAVDAILYTFARMTRLVRARVESRLDERLDDSCRAFFERKGRELAPLRRAVLAVMDGEEPRSLRPFHPLLKDLEEQGTVVRWEEGYFQLLGNRGTFLRQIVRHLQGIPPEGRDPNARAVIRALPELFRFAPFATLVPRNVRRTLRFLAVSDRRLSRRRVFETVLATTLADLLWVGRVTSPSSHEFGDRWSAVTKVGKVGWQPLSLRVAEAREELSKAWTMLEAEASSERAIKNGRLIARRVPRKWLEEEEELHRAAQKRLAARVPYRSVVDVLLEVHRSTGMLDAFRPPPFARHRLDPEKVIRSAIAVVAGRGLNLGVEAMVSLLGPGARPGRLWSFDEIYVTRRALEDANRILLDRWDATGMGRPWGNGDTGAADGKSVEAPTRSLRSGHHVRHRLTGKSLYWLVRDDWIAAKVGVIPAHDWESWHLLEAMLKPRGGRPLRWAAGDTHGQHLALWGLAFLMRKEIRARFRGLGQVKLYGDGGGRVHPLEGVEPIRWKVVEDSLPSLARLVEAVRQGHLSTEHLLRTANVYDDTGANVMEALRELGKAVRTAYWSRAAVLPDSVVLSSSFGDVLARLRWPEERHTLEVDHRALPRLSA